jgi:hypothetical protein
MKQKKTTIQSSPSMLSPDGLEAAFFKTCLFSGI